MLFFLLAPKVIDLQNVGPVQLVWNSFDEKRGPTFHTAFTMRLVFNMSHFHNHSSQRSDSAPCFLFVQRKLFSRSKGMIHLNVLNGTDPDLPWLLCAKLPKGAARRPVHQKLWVCGQPMQPLVLPSTASLSWAVRVTIFSRWRCSPIDLAPGYSDHLAGVQEATEACALGLACDQRPLVGCVLRGAPPPHFPHLRPPHWAPPLCRPSLAGTPSASRLLGGAGGSGTRVSPRARLLPARGSGTDPPLRVSPAVTDLSALTCLHVDTTRSLATCRPPSLSQWAVSSRPRASHPMQPVHQLSPSWAGKPRHFAQTWGGIYYPTKAISRNTRQTCKHQPMPLADVIVPLCIFIHQENIPEKCDVFHSIRRPPELKNKNRETPRHVYYGWLRIWGVHKHPKIKFINSKTVLYIYICMYSQHRNIQIYNKLNSEY